jgi:hypothetical protein
VDNVKKGQTLKRSNELNATLISMQLQDNTQQEKYFQKKLTMLEL